MEQISAERSCTYLPVVKDLPFIMCTKIFESIMIVIRRTYIEGYLHYLYCSNISLNTSDENIRRAKGKVHQTSSDSRFKYDIPTDMIISQK